MLITHFVGGCHWMIISSCVFSNGQSWPLYTLCMDIIRREGRREWSMQWRTVNITKSGRQSFLGIWCQGVMSDLCGQVLRWSCTSSNKYPLHVWIEIQGGSIQIRNKTKQNRITWNSPRNIWRTIVWTKPWVREWRRETLGGQRMEREKSKRKGERKRLKGLSTLWWCPWSFWSCSESCCCCFRV